MMVGSIATMVLATHFARTQPPVIYAMMHVESSHEVDPEPGDNRQSHGILQIQQGYIDDVNETFGTQFTLKHTYSVPHAILITRLYNKRYGDGTWETLARNHNGGPTGYRKQSTVQYWANVTEILEGWNVYDRPKIH